MKSREQNATEAIVMAADYDAALIPPRYEVIVQS